MRPGARRIPVLGWLLLAVPVLGQNSTTATPTVSTSAPANGATATDTQLLSVPTYSTTATFASSAASAIATSLPAYTYNLTQESLATRTAICNLTTADCASAGCSDSSATVTVNFCNPTTMGWNCECSNKATSRLQPPIVPVNSYDCRLRTSACLDACQNPHATPAVTSVTACQNACNYIIGSTCGTYSQFIPWYQVSSYGDTPKYYPDTSKGGAAAGITTSEAARLALGVLPHLALVGLVFAVLA